MAELSAQAPSPAASRAMPFAYRRFMLFPSAFRRTLLCAALAAPAAPSALAAETSRDGNAALERAVEIYEEGDYPRAQAAFEALVRLGSPAAMHDLAVMHLHGEATGASAEAARKLLQSAAERGFVTAQLALGELYEGSRLGKPDLAGALRWYQQAAASGSVDGQLAVATAHLMGRGTPVDMVEAASWYRLAATRGDVGAQYILASLYEKGDGVPADLRLARYWYAAAATQGDDAAPDKVREMDARLAGSGPAAASPAR